MKALISQPFGLGDHIFTVTIARDLIKKGMEVVYPVQGHYLEGNKRAYPDIQWVHVDEIDNGLLEIKRKEKAGGYEVYPLRWANEILRLPYKDCMKAKYLWYGWNYRDWTKNAQWARNSETEAKLAELVGATGEYTLVNRYFRGDASGVADIRVEGNVVEMRNIEGFSLFDWGQVIENASQIHTVSTSILYMLEMMLFNHVIHLYKRWPDERDHRNYQYLLRDNRYKLL